VAPVPPGVGRMVGLTVGLRTGSIAPMPAPFLSYLRVYEPLRAFEGSTGAQVRAALARGPLAPERAGSHEREVCLRTQLGARLLPEDAELGRRPRDVVRACLDREQHQRAAECRDRGETFRRRPDHGKSSAKLTESIPAFALMRNATTHAPGMWNLSPSTR